MENRMLEGLSYEEKHGKVWESFEILAAEGLFSVEEGMRISENINEKYPDPQNENS